MTGKKQEERAKPRWVQGSLGLDGLRESLLQTRMGLQETMDGYVDEIRRKRELLSRMKRRGGG